MECSNQNELEISLGYSVYIKIIELKYSDTFTFYHYDSSVIIVHDLDPVGLRSDVRIGVTESR